MASKKRKFKKIETPREIINSWIDFLELGDKRHKTDLKKAFLYYIEDINFDTLGSFEAAEIFTHIYNWLSGIAVPEYTYVAFDWDGEPYLETSGGLCARLIDLRREIEKFKKMWERSLD